MHGWWAVSYVVLWLLVIGLALLSLALARQVGTLHLRLGPRGALEIDHEGPPLGEAPEPLELADLDGRPISLGGPGPKAMEKQLAHAHWLHKCEGYPRIA